MCGDPDAFRIVPVTSTTERMEDRDMDMSSDNPSQNPSETPNAPSDPTPNPPSDPTTNPTTSPEGEAPDLRAEARRWVRRQRVLYTMLGVYAVLSLMWFTIDLADDSEGFWFYWPMLGVGVAVAVAAVILLGVGGLFGMDWERRQIERYVRQRGR
jgi:hypothetical protein